MKTLIARFKNLKAKITKSFIIAFPGKNTFNIKVFGLVIVPLALLFGIAYAFIAKPDDTSRLASSAESIRDKLQKKVEGVAKAKETLKGISNQQEDKAKKTQDDGHGVRRMSQINYRAKQVLERPDYSDPNNTLPTGTELIGRLATSIDTRELGSIIKIELPYGGSFQGNELVPRGSTLFAGVKYDGNGEKVFLDVQSGVYPDGSEFKIRAQALSARDFSPGIAGDYHGTFSNRVAANLGLAFVSGLTDAMTEKESLGGGSAFSSAPVHAKPTLKNGLLAGVSKVTDTEAQRMANELAGQKSYVTVDSGKELIVSLLERFVKTK
jgi:hypothetical protein